MARFNSSGDPGEGGMNEDFITLKEAAQILGVTMQTLTLLKKRGWLLTETFPGGDELVSTKEIQRMIGAE